MNTWVELSSFWVTDDRVVSQDRCRLWGFILQASADGGSVSIYNKNSPDAEALFGTFKGLANSPTVAMFPRGIPFDRGLYLEVVANVTGVLLLVEPVFEPSQAG